MKKVLLAVFASLLLIPAFSFAQEQITVRSLAVDQLFEYGRAIYNRGDYPQAGVIFTRILKMDPQNQEALKYVEYLKKKGGGVMPTNPIPSIQAFAVEKQHNPSDIEIFKDLRSNQDLKQEISDSDQAIEKESNEIEGLRQLMKEHQQEK